jgi:hypothetical protein
MNGERMDRVKIVADNASIILWVTAGDLLGGKSPNFAHVQGLSRALMMGQSSLRFLTFDVDNIQRRTNRTTGNIVSVLKRSAGGLHDYEYIERDGVVHTRRFIPDDQLNDFFRQKQGAELIELPISVRSLLKFRSRTQANSTQSISNRSSFPRLLGPAKYKLKSKL